MYRTKIDLPEKVRGNMIPVLQERLADAIDFQTQAKQAHWNVKGPNFIALHELFDKVAEASEEYVDLIAERIVQFGGTAEGTIGAVAQRTSLPAYPLNLTSGVQHVAALSTALANFGELTRKAIGMADEVNDACTADIFTEISRDVDKYLWFVEAHTQSE